MREEQDKQQFFKDLGATAEQTVEEVRGVEENYFALMQGMLTPVPGIAEVNINCRTMPKKILQMR